MNKKQIVVWTLFAAIAAIFVLSSINPDATDSCKEVADYLFCANQYKNSIVVGSIIIVVVAFFLALALHYVLKDKARKNTGHTEKAVPSHDIEAQTVENKHEKPKTKSNSVSQTFGVIGGITAFVVVSTITRAILHPNQTGTQKLQNYINSTEWKEYNATAGNFTADFPTVPTVDTTKETAENMTIPFTMYSSLPNDKEAYMVAIAEYPADLDVSNTTGILDGAVNGAVHNVENGKLISSSFSSFLGYPAVDILMSAGSTGYIQAKAFLVGHKMYMLENVEPTNSFPDYDRFVNSFQVR